METGFLNFHDEEHFSDFSLSLEQNLVEKPQDLLMHMVENDFDYMETHFDIANADNLWNNEQRHNEDVDSMSILEMPTISKIDSIKEDFTKVLTDWQEHIGYLQASDMDEYMDIIGFSMNATDRRNHCASENILYNEQTTYAPDSDAVMTKQTDLEMDSLDIDQKNTTENELCHKISDFTESDSKKVKNKSVSLLLEPKCLRKQNKLKKNTHKCDSRGIDDHADPLKKQKKRKKGKSLLCNSNREGDIHNSDKSFTNQWPALEAGDVKSLLEQFEASENSLIATNKPSKISSEYEYNSSLTCNEIQQCVKQYEKSSFHKNIRDALPKEVVENIKTSARKKVISVVPAIPNIRGNSHSNGTRMQDAAATLFRNKLLKIVTNNPKNNAVDGGLVQLDHDYCGTNSSISSSDSNSEYERQSSDSEKASLIKTDSQQLSNYYTTYKKQSFVSRVNRSLIQSRECSMENSYKKDSGLESGDISDNSEEHSVVTIVSDVQIQKTQNKIQDFKIQTSINQANNNVANASINASNQNLAASINNSAHKVKMHSDLATSILQLRQGILTKENSTGIRNQRTTQMVSVLKKPPNVQQVSILMTASNQSVVTTTNSANDEIQNIIIQDDEKVLTPEMDKKPPRKKLNLAEYRSRREQNRSDNSRTNSPLQPMTLVYVHHASTTTEPIKDDLDNLIWSEREIVSALKSKIDIDENKVCPKPLTRNIGIQTNETVFEFPSKSSIDVDERHEEERDHDIPSGKQRTCDGSKVGSSSSRSRSRSLSKSKSRSRSRSRNRSLSRSKSRCSTRNRSRKRSNIRHRRISHRCSSVSTNSSLSSRSHSRSRSRSRSRSHRRSRSCLRTRSCSDTRSSCSSRSRYSRSRSRSSRSRSSSRYSSCSRSSSRSDCRKNKWPRRRKEHRRYHRSYERHRQHSTGNYHSYRDWRRSPTNSYQRSYDNWYDREKQRQVEERRVIYVGRLDEGITKADLRRRFEVFGPVVDISVHFRERGDNYGFVTFAYKNDAYEAIEHGNDDPSLPRYDLCFGGRRAFCKVKYADLDGMASSSLNSGRILPENQDNTFDLLLKEAKAKLRKRKV